MIRKIAIIAISISLAVFVAIADSDVPAEGFDTSLSLGLTLTDGNSNTTLANASLSTIGRKPGVGRLRAGVEGSYGESKVDGVNQTTMEELRAFANAHKNISARTFFALHGDALYDDIAEIDYRITVSPGIGYTLIDGSSLTLSTEVGPAYLWEKVSKQTDDYFAIRFAERLDYRMSETARLWQSAEYLPKSDDFNDYLLSAELGAEASLTSRMSLRILLRNEYDNTPGTGLKHNDLTLISGVSISL